jgi:hypothetical protein
MAMFVFHSSHLSPPPVALSSSKVQDLVEMPQVHTSLSVVHHCMVVSMAEHLETNKGMEDLCPQEGNQVSNRKYLFT